MRKIFYYVLSLSLLLGCEFDFNTEKSFKDFKPKVVVNSIISTDSVVKVKLFWSRYYKDTTKIFRGVESFEGKLFEDDVLVENGSYKDGFMLTSYYPKEGKTYRVVFDVPNYGEVSAVTNIPLKAIAKVVCHGEKEGGGEYQYIEVESLKTTQKVRAVWIRAGGEYTSKGEQQVKDVKAARELYSDNVFADQINAVLDLNPSADTGSDLGYEQFMRMPYQSITQSVPIQFYSYISSSISDYTSEPEYNEDGSQIYKYFFLNYICVEVSTPSDDYDKYYKSLYKQELYGDSPDLPFASEMVNVHSNVKNGAGIFAGRSVELVRFKYMSGEKHK